MNSEEDEFRRIEAEAKRRAAGDDGIIRMAREAGFERVVAIHSDGSKTVTVAPVLELEAFAALIAAAELRRLHHNNLVLTNALWKACGDDREVVNATIESQGDLE